MKIVLYPHPALRWKSRPITEINAALRSTVQQMFELMYEHKGIGLAANQVGLPLRLFVINPTGDPDEKDQEFVLINPEITHRKGSDEAEEGCLSLPELFGPVRRPSEVVVDAYDIKGQGFELKLDDLPARVVQHEYDHIDGVLFIDRMTEMRRRELEPRISDFEALYRHQQETGELPSDEAIKQQLRKLESK